MTGLTRIGILAAGKSTNTPSPTEEVKKSVSEWTSEFHQTFLGHVAAIVLIIVLAFVVAVILRFLVHRFVDALVHGAKRSANADDTQALMASPLSTVRTVQRARTIGSVLNNVIIWVVVVVAGIAVLGQMGVNLTALIASAGVVAAGLAFGAQNVVKDMLTGLFMVFEDQIGVGDVVDVGNAVGVVEGVGIRITKIRDVNGTLWFCRNGEIVRVGNMSQGWQRVIVDLGVPYEADVDAVQERMLATATTLARESKWKSRVVDRPEIWGLESISADAVVLRVVVKTRAAAKDDVARELRARLKAALDDMGITLPSLESVLLEGAEGAMSVTGARPPKTSEIAIAEAASLRKGSRRKRGSSPAATATRVAQDPDAAARAKAIADAESTPGGMDSGLTLPAKDAAPRTRKPKPAADPAEPPAAHPTETDQP